MALTDYRQMLENLTDNRHCEPPIRTLLYASIEGPEIEEQKSCKQ